jgi:hypothetical protein
LVMGWKLITTSRLADGRIMLSGDISCFGRDAC